LSAIAEIAETRREAPAKADRPSPRRRVLDAAAQCFTRNGFHSTSMHQICAAAEMSPGALYRYFPSKESIIIAIVEEERSARVALFEELDQAPSFVGGLLEMGRKLFSGELPFLCADLGPEVAAEAARNDKLKTMFEDVEAEMNTAMRRALVKGQERGEIARNLDLDSVLLMINSIGDGLQIRKNLEPPGALVDALPGLGVLLTRMLAPQSAPRNTESTDIES
jgi:TetR/AcrR family transcriptional repressor of uid operon